MNPFVNPKKRGILLPSGCKNLIDMLNRPKGVDEAGSQSPVIRPEIQVGDLSYLHRYVAKLSASSAYSAVLTIASLDGQIRVMLEHSGGHLSVYPVMGLTEMEKDTEDFFTERAIQPCVDYVVGHPGMATRVLGYPLPSDHFKAAELTTDLIRSVYGGDAEAEIEFAYLETAAT
jgi:hypothetical protein